MRKLYTRIEQDVYLYEITFIIYLFFFACSLMCACACVQKPLSATEFLYHVSLTVHV